MARYRRRPVEVDAVQLRWEHWSEVSDFMASCPHAHARGIFNPVDHHGIGVELMDDHEVTRFARTDDWLVRDRGELSVCKPDRFAELYEDT